MYLTTLLQRALVNGLLNPLDLGEVLSSYFYIGSLGVDF